MRKPKLWARGELFAKGGDSRKGIVFLGLSGLHVEQRFNLPRNGWLWAGNYRFHKGRGFILDCRPVEMTGSEYAVCYSV